VNSHYASWAWLRRESVLLSTPGHHSLEAGISQTWGRRPVCRWAAKSHSEPLRSLALNSRMEEEDLPP
jgi:hypothetical protein